MIFGHLGRVREVQALSADVANREIRFQRKVGTFGTELHERFGSFRLLLGGFSAGFLFDRLRPHWRGVRTGSNLGLSLLKLLPLVELVGRSISRNDAGVD